MKGQSRVCGAQMETSQIKLSHFKVVKSSDNQKTMCFHARYQARVRINVVPEIWEF